MAGLREGIQRSLAAVVVVIILGIQTPADAFLLSYAVNGDLENGDVVNGTFGWDQDASGELYIEDGDTIVYTLYLNGVPGGADNDVFFTDYTPPDNTQLQIVIEGQWEYTSGTRTIIPQSSFLLVFDESTNSYDAVYFANGTVTAGISEVPEPSSIMATVTAVTLGVVLRWKKRKI